LLEFGFVKLFRKFTTWEWYKDQNTKDIFLHLLLTANYEDKSWRGFLVKRGQRIASYKTLSLETGISVQCVRTSIKRLKSTSELTSQITSEYSVFTVVKYEEYQGLTSELTFNQQAINTQLTSDQQATNNNVRKIKKDKKDKEVKEDIYIPYQSIIDYLNLKANTKYKHTSQKTQTLIHARWMEKFTEQDFYTVIDKKVADWLNDPKMNQYLRPETLFGTKFEGYLNDKGDSNGQNSGDNQQDSTGKYDTSKIMYNGSTDLADEPIDF